MFSYIASGHEHSQPYFVNVQSMHLHNRPDIADYHLVIHATEQEKNEIMELMRSIENHDEGSFYSMLMMLNTSEDQDLSVGNNSYDKKLQRLFSRLYELGTEETKKHIQSMNIL